MTKLKKSLDNQPSLFDLIMEQSLRHDAPLPGSLDMEKPFREAISAALKACSLSRYQVAAQMSELTGTDITKTMLDSWTAESKEQHRFPAIFLDAFCVAAGSTEPIRILAQPVGVFVMPGPEVMRADIRRIEEVIIKKQAEKKRKLTILEEMEGAR